MGKRWWKEEGGVSDGEGKMGRRGERWCEEGKMGRSKEENQKSPLKHCHICQPLTH